MKVTMRSRKKVELVNNSKNKPQQFEFRNVCEWKMRERSVNWSKLIRKKRFKRSAK